MTYLPNWLGGFATIAGILIVMAVLIAVATKAAERVVRWCEAADRKADRDEEEAAAIRAHRYE